MALRMLRLLSWLAIIGMLGGNMPRPAFALAQGAAASQTSSASIAPNDPFENAAPPMQVPAVVDPHLPSLVMNIVVAPDPVPVGETAAFTFTLTNQASDAASNVVVTIPTPDGALAEPGDGVINPAKGWQWNVPRVAALSETVFRGSVRLLRMPKGDALLLRPEVTAAELAQPIAIYGGALAWDRAKGSSRSAFAPGQAAKLQGENGRLNVAFPGNASKKALELQYRTLEVARDDLVAKQRPVPNAIANFKRAFAPVVLDAIDSAGQEVHQFDAPLPITWRYTPEQLLARGISAADLTVFWFNEDIKQWVTVPSSVDEQNQTVSAVVDHFSAFTLGDGSSPSDAYLPSLKGWQVSTFTGAVSYNYPIEVPAGPGGLKPSVSLNYSSAATDGATGGRNKQQAGIIGKGWSLDFGSVGVRKIVRDASTANIVKTYTLTLNGQSYDVERGNAMSGVTSPDPDVPSDWEWHTTDESYLKIYATTNGVSTDHAAGVAENTQYPIANSTYGRGGMLSGVWQTRYIWHIWAKDGTHYQYKEDLWSGMDRCTPALEYDFEPYKWLLSSVTDTFGNTVTYNYDRQVYVGSQWVCGSNRTMRGTVDQDAWPTSITWANNRYRVVFQTSARTNDTAFDGPDKQYLNDNGKPRDTKELDAIKVQSSTDGTSWSLIRQYNLAQNYSLYSDERLCSGSTCTANTTYPKLTLTAIQQIGRDGTSGLPSVTFGYETNGGTTSVAAGGWQRLKTANNGQSGTATFAYDNVQAITGKNIFGNRNRVKTKTLNDGRGTNYTWSYSYGTPAMNSLGTIVAADMDSADGYKALYAQGPNSYPNSAILYLNLYTGPAYRYESWLAQPPTKEFRGHDWVQETDPNGGVTKHFFYQGDVGCYPQDPADGSPLGNETNIKNNACFQAMRDREFLKGREYETQILASGSATNPLQKVIHTFGVTFFDYGTERLSGLWHAFTHEDQTETRYHEGDSTYRSSKVGYCYFATCAGTTYQSADFGNLTRKAEYDDSGNVIRRTEYFYLTTNTSSNYIVDKAYQEQVTDGAGVFRALTSRFYDNTSDPRTIPTDGALRRESRYYDVPAVTTIPNSTTMHGVDTVYGYDSYGNRTTVTSYAGYGTRVKDANGIISWSPPGNSSAASTTTTTYDATFHALAIQESNALSQLTRADYDDVTGSLLRITGPNTTTTPKDCSVANFTTIPITEETTCATYDVFGRMVGLVKPGDSSSLPTVEWVYADTESPVRYVTRQREVSGQATYRATQTFYDGLGRSIQVKRISGRDGTGAASQVIISDTQYDGLANTTKTSQPRYVSQTGSVYGSYTAPGTSWNNPTSTTYDALGRPLVVTPPDNKTTQYSYGEDADGRWTKTIDANSHAVVRWSDTLGRLQIVREYTGTVTPRTLYATTNYGYSALDLLNGVDDNAGNHTSIGYDTIGRKTGITDPDMGTWAYGYDPDGNLTVQVDAKSQRLCFYYDALNRLTAKHQNGTAACPGSAPATPTMTYTYDTGTNGKGHRTQMKVNGGAQTDWTYDARGRTSTISQSAGGVTLNYTNVYNTADQLTQIQFPLEGDLAAENLTYTYDVAWRPASACSSLGVCYVSSATYTALDQPDIWKLSDNAITRDAAYNSVARLTSLNVSAAVTIMNRGYGYDNAGNISSITDTTPGTPLGNQSFVYDDLNRLSSWTSSLGSQTFTYNAIGNITSKPGGGVYGYGAQSSGCAAGALSKPHAVVSNTTGGYCYDANGNLVSGGGRSYVWTPENLPSSITSGAATETYSYDADGERVTRTAAGATTVYLGGAEEQTGSALKRFYSFNGQTIALRTSTGVTYLHGDHLGSVSASSDSAGSSIARQYFDPWGQIKSGAISATTLNYTGQRLDGTGLLYYHARMYDPVLARFVSADSVVPGASAMTIGPDKASNGPADPQQLNRFSYVSNNPVKNTDPTGHFAWLLVGFAVGAGIDLASQLYSNGGDISKVNVTQTLVSGAVGAIGVGTGGFIAKASLTLGKAILANAVVSGFVSGVGAAVQNALQDPALPKADIATAAGVGALTGGVGAAVGAAAKGMTKALVNARYERLTLAEKLFLNSSAVIRDTNARSRYDYMYAAGNALSIAASNAGPAVPVTPQSSSQ